MSTSRDLAAHLKALAEEEPQFDGRARVLDHSAPLDAILAEIDSAVLPTQMRFDTGGAVLCLLASGRRLHRLDDGAPEDLKGQPLDPENADRIDSAAQALARFADGAASLTVTHAAPPADAGDMSDRVSVRRLEDALGIVRDDPDAPLPVRFVTRMGDAIRAALYLNDRVLGDVVGDGADVAGLKIILSTQLSAFVDAREAQCASHVDPSLTLFADVLEPGQSVGIAAFDADIVLFAYPTEAAARAHDAFRRIR